MVEGGQHMDGNLYEAARQGRNIPGDVDDQQLRTRTPGDYNNVLHVAAQYGNQNFITLTVARLGEHRCQLLCQRNSKGETPLHLAAQFGNLETVRVLLTAHDDPQLNTDVLFTNQKKPCWNERDRQGDTPLHMALRFGHEDIALLLLDKDSHVVSIENDLGESLAFLAAENYCKRFLVRILNEDHFSRHVSLSGPSGQTVFHPLHIALINCKYIPAFALMSIHGCNGRLKNNEGLNAFDLCESNDAKYSPITVLRYLKDKQPKVWEREIIRCLGTFITVCVSMCSANLSKMEDEALENLQNRIAIAAALLIPLVFSVTFDVPGGFDSTTGKPRLSEQLSFQFFMYSDGVAFMTAMTTLFF